MSKEFESSLQLGRLIGKWVLNEVLIGEKKSQMKRKVQAF